jgi:hypothetical protein
MDNEILLGRTNRLRVVRQVDFGYYLQGTVRGETVDVLLPSGETEGHTLALDDEADVFIYLDQEERIIATMKKPLAMVGDFAYLEVAWVNQYGAFLDWGLMKDLFVPFREQKMKMQKGQSYIVHLHVDPQSYRIMASAKVEHWLSQDMPPYQSGDEVDILVWQKTELGMKAIVDNRYGGLLYDAQIFRPIRTGDRLKAYVRTVRTDGKIDLILQRPGQEAVEDFGEVLMQYLSENGGTTTLGDKSEASEIYATFGVSKKVFKKTVGDLYRRRLITFSDDGGIQLVETNSAET